MDLGLIEHWRRPAECLRAERAEQRADLLERWADELEAILVTVSLPGAEADGPQQRDERAHRHAFIDCA